jgi:superfamily I DNA/RNA helicase
MFNKSQIDNLFSLDKDQLVATPDSKYVLYKFDRGLKFEFRLETEFITLERFYLEKNLRSKTKLVKILENLGKYGE